MTAFHRDTITCEDMSRRDLPISTQLRYDCDYEPVLRCATGKLPRSMDSDVTLENGKMKTMTDVDRKIS